MEKEDLRIVLTNSPVKERGGGTLKLNILLIFVAQKGNFLCYLSQDNCKLLINMIVGTV